MEGNYEKKMFRKKKKAWKNVGVEHAFLQIINGG